MNVTATMHTGIVADATALVEGAVCRVEERAADHRLQWHGPGCPLHADSRRTRMALRRGQKKTRSGNIRNDMRDKRGGGWSRAIQNHADREKGQVCFRIDGNCGGKGPIRNRLCRQVRKMRRAWD